MLAGQLFPYIVVKKNPDSLSTILEQGLLKQGAPSRRTGARRLGVTWWERSERDRVCRGCMKGNRLAEHLACRSSGTIMVICGHLTVSTRSNAGKNNFPLPTCLRPIVHTNARPSTAAAAAAETFPERRSAHRAARPRAQRMEVEQSKKSSCFGDKSGAHTLAHDACVC